MHCTEYMLVDSKFISAPSCVKWGVGSHDLEKDTTPLNSMTVL